jgi:glyoxylase-like metal-dependent hydrolase (beta-lactamase superfamily II)
MEKLEIKKLILGDLQTNVYIIYDSKRKEAIIIDPADEPGCIMNNLHKLNVKPVAILLTHGHYDHILGANMLKDFYRIPIIAHYFERGLLHDTVKNLSAINECSVRVRANEYMKDLDTFEIGGIKIQVIYTPGHTNGSCCYYLYEQDVLFSGDTMFYASCGRTDFPTGSSEKMEKSLQKLLKLPKHTAVFPGHGEQTTIGIERRHFPWYM